MIRELTGYTDPLTASPGTKLRFMISTDAPQYEVKLVRLIHGDENPDGGASGGLNSLGRLFGEWLHRRRAIQHLT